MSTTRPLSPHLGIYRWRVNMLQSTLHRLTGMLLCAAALLLTWGLVAAASSAAAWSVFAGFCGSWLGVAVLFASSWALLYHLCNGIHHLLRDAGLNFGPPVRDRTRSPVYWTSGWLVIGLSVVLTVLAWLTLYAGVMGGAA